MSDSLQIAVVTVIAAVAAAVKWWPRRRHASGTMSSKDSCPGCGTCGDDTASVTPSRKS